MKRLLVLTLILSISHNIWAQKADTAGAVKIFQGNPTQQLDKFHRQAKYGYLLATLGTVTCLTGVVANNKVIGVTGGIVSLAGIISFALADKYLKNATVALTNNGLTVPIKSMNRSDKRNRGIEIGINSGASNCSLPGSGYDTAYLQNPQYFYSITLAHNIQVSFVKDSWKFGIELGTAKLLSGYRAQLIIDPDIYTQDIYQVYADRMYSTNLIVDRTFGWGNAEPYLGFSIGAIFYNNTDIDNISHPYYSYIVQKKLTDKGTAFTSGITAGYTHYIGSHVGLGALLACRYIHFTDKIVVNADKNICMFPFMLSLKYNIHRK